jgi:hypothetical protein
METCPGRKNAESRRPQNCTDLQCDGVGGLGKIEDRGVSKGGQCGRSNRDDKEAATVMCEVGHATRTKRPKHLFHPSGLAEF